MGAFNSQEYGWKDITVEMAGRVISTLQNISYTTERQLDYNYGAGDDPLSIQSGNKAYPGEVGINQSDLDAMTRSAKAQGYEDATDIAFDVVVNYAKQVTDPQVTDILRHCRISSLPKGGNQGDPKMVSNLSLMILKIEYDV